MPTGLVCGIAITIATAPLVWTQEPAAMPAAFDAASIKPAAVPLNREGGNRSRIEYTPTSLTMRNVAIGECVQWAYGIAEFQLAGSNLRSESYDITARTGAPATLRQLRAMLQELLARRFNLTLHRETRMLAAYELVVAKGGAKLPAPKSDGSLPSIRGVESLPRVESDSFVFADVSLHEFAAMLTQLRGIESPVVNRTGIQGTFDLTLKSAPAAAREGDTGALIAIVQDQLGLKMSRTKAPIEVIVIDHVDRPTAN